ncbi:MAG: hypothetical protein ACE5FV_11035 [Woeseia sp.]
MSKRRTILIAAVGFMVLTAGCAAPSAIVKKTFDDPTYTESSYSDILVIGVAGGYSDRAALERAMVSRIKGEGATAAAYYTVVGRNQPITRDLVSNIVRAREFDAVLLCRIISHESNISVDGRSSRTQSSRRPPTRAIDLFRYDYEELADPGTAAISRTVTVSSEFFHSADERRMWAIESTIDDVDNIRQVIEAAAAIVVDKLRDDKLIGS